MLPMSSVSLRWVRQSWVNTSRPLAPVSQRYQRHQTVQVARQAGEYPTHHWRSAVPV